MNMLHPLYISTMCFTCYLIGSIPTAYLIAKISKGVDIRNYGSGNPGAANVYRNVSKTSGIITLVLDVLKGFIPTILTKTIYPGNIGIPLLCGMLTIIGHNWSVFIGFRGGKGVATGTGAVLALVPGSTLFGFIVFVVVFITTKYVSLSSITAAVVISLTCWFRNYPTILSLVITIIGLIIIYRHKSNIKRLLNGTERKTYLVSDKKIVSKL